MNSLLSQTQSQSLFDDQKTYQRLLLNCQKNKVQDRSPELDRLSQQFNYEACKNLQWNPERFSLFYQTPLWDQASEYQRIKLNQLYWIAYYSQIISAEIATIFFNQTSAAALYGIEDFRVVCDTLDLESMQERAHIHAFKKVSEDFELAEFGERLFTYPMRTPYVETMIFQNTNRVKEFWKKIQLMSFTLLSSHRAFIGCQYFTIRGLRTLNGKIVQHALSQFYMKSIDPENTPIPSKISYDHFLDESFHFNSSLIISHEVVKSLAPPTSFEKKLVNHMIWGCQRDHFNFSTAINGIFWYDPALYPVTYRLLRSDLFSMEHEEALIMMEKIFTQESEGMIASSQTHRTARNSYKEYLANMTFVDRKNREMDLMGRNTLERHLETNRYEMRRFREKANQLKVQISSQALSRPESTNDLQKVAV